MIRALIICLGLLTSPALADGSTVQNGACFSASDRLIQLCVPAHYALVELEVTDNLIWAHFEDEYVSLSINTYPVPDASLSPVASIEEVFADSQIAVEVASMSADLEQWKLHRFHEPGQVLEVVARTDDLNIYFMETRTPTVVFLVAVRDFSPEFPDAHVDFQKAASGIRYMTHFDTGKPFQLGAFSELEPAK